MSKISRRGFMVAGMASYASAMGSGNNGSEKQKRTSSLARIITTCQSRHAYRTPEGNREYMLDLFKRALKHKPDLVCLPEAFTRRGVPEADRAKVFEPVPGPTTDAFAQLAKAHRSYVICPILTLREGKRWNSAVIIDRAGEILGIYDKVHPVTTSYDYTEFERGISPGSEPRVFDLDFGRIGVQICFDAGFPESWEKLAREGVKAVFWPSAYDGGFVLEVYASLHHYYVITSVRTDRSRIINPCGRVVAQTDDRVNFVVRDINLDFVVAHYDFNWAIPDRIIDAYPGRVKITSYVDDAHFIVEPTDPSISTEQLRKEFGFEPTWLYHERHRKAHALMLASQVPKPQKAAHGDRPQYSK